MSGLMSFELRYVIRARVSREFRYNLEVRPDGNPGVGYCKHTD